MSLVVRNLNEVVVALEPSAYVERTDALYAAQLVAVVRDDLTESLAFSALKALKGISRLVEADRKKVKGPILELGKRIDAAAAEFLADVEKEARRIENVLAPYVAEKRRVAEEAERKRQAEIRARIEEERRQQAALIEAEAKARREAEEASRQAQASRDRASAAAARQAEDKAREMEAQRLAAEDEAKLKRLQDIMRAPEAPEKPEGTVVRESWDFEVLDVHALYQAHPDLCTVTPKRADILALLRSGTREVPGLRIFQTVKVGVRS